MNLTVYKLRSIVSLQPNPRMLRKQKYYQHNAAKMRVVTGERKISDGLASPVSILPPIPKAERKADEEAEEKEKAQAKITLPKPENQEKEASQET